MKVAGDVILGSPFVGNGKTQDRQVFVGRVRAVSFRNILDPAPQNFWQIRVWLALLVAQLVTHQAELRFAEHFEDFGVLDKLLGVLNSVDDSSDEQPDSFDAIVLVEVIEAQSGRSPPCIDRPLLVINDMFLIIGYIIFIIIWVQEGNKLFFVPNKKGSSRKPK